MKEHHDLNVLTVLQWVARVAGTALALFMMFMLLSYTFGSERSIPGALWLVTFALFVLGVGLAWKWETLGGLLILVASVLFFVFNPHVIWPPGIYHVMPLVAFLLLLCSFRLRYRQKEQSEDR